MASPQSSSTAPSQSSSSSTANGGVPPRSKPCATQAGSPSPAIAFSSAAIAANSTAHSSIRKAPMACGASPGESPGLGGPCNSAGIAVELNYDYALVRVAPRFVGVYRPTGSLDWSLVGQIMIPEEASTASGSHGVAEIHGGFPGLGDFPAHRHRLGLRRATAARGLRQRHGPRQRRRVSRWRAARAGRLERDASVHEAVCVSRERRRHLRSCRNPRDLRIHARLRNQQKHGLCEFRNHR